MTAASPRKRAQHEAEVVERYLEQLRKKVWRTGRVAVPGFGVFRVRPRKARKVVNPANPEEKLSIPKGKQVTFRASKHWRRGAP